MEIFALERQACRSSAYVLRRRRRRKVHAGCFFSRNSEGTGGAAAPQNGGVKVQRRLSFFDKIANKRAAAERRYALGDALPSRPLPAQSAGNVRRPDQHAARPRNDDGRYAPRTRAAFLRCRASKPAAMRGFRIFPSRRLQTQAVNFLRMKQRGAKRPLATPMPPGRARGAAAGYVRRQHACRQHASTPLVMQQLIFLQRTTLYAISISVERGQNHARDAQRRAFAPSTQGARSRPRMPECHARETVKRCT